MGFSNETRMVVKIAALILVLWVAMFAIDCHRCSSLQHPLFVVSLTTADDGGSGTYIGIGNSVEMDVSLDAEDGLIVESEEMRLLGMFTVAASIS